MSDENPSSSLSHDRFHALDAARGFALLLGIVLHATMSFFLFIPAQDPSQSTTLAVTFYVIHVFRMSVFFLLAGFFAHLLLERRGPRAFVKDRAKRILVPMIAGWLLLAPPTIYIVIVGLTRTFGEAARPKAQRRCRRAFRSYTCGSCITCASSMRWRWRSGRHSSASSIRTAPCARASMQCCASVLPATSRRSCLPPRSSPSFIRTQPGCCGSGCRRPTPGLCRSSRRSPVSAPRLCSAGCCTGSPPARGISPAVLRQSRGGRVPHRAVPVARRA